MIKNITASEFTAAFHNMGRGDQFSHSALLALYEFLNEVNPAWELDVTAVCCDFSECSAEFIAQDYGFDAQADDEDDDEFTARILDELNEKTWAVKTRDGILYQN